MRPRKPLNQISLAEVNQVLKKRSVKVRKELKIPDETWALAGIPKPVQELRFHPVRRWRYDYAWPSVTVGGKDVEVKVAVEVEGVSRTGTRHQRIDGMRKDTHKYNAAALEGWVVLRYLQREVDYKQVAEMIQSRIDSSLSNS